MVEGLTRIVKELLATDQLQGIISLGGSGGTTISTGAMQQLPLGVPKVVVGTMACGNTVPYIMGQDILLINSVVDMQSLNFLSKHILDEAARIVCSLANMPKLTRQKKKAIGITCFGVTTPCVDRCTELLEKEGYEILIFHARGVSGGKIMEKMISEGFFTAVLDITTTELIDEIAGGGYAIGNERLRAAVKKNIPYIVCPGAADMINIGPKENLKPEQADHVQYFHNSSLLKLRANKDEMIRLADLFVDRLKDSDGKTHLVIPTNGFDEIDKEGNVFFDPEADAAFARRVKETMPDNVPVICRDNHINDKEFADFLVKDLLGLIEGTGKQ